MLVKNEKNDLFCSMIMNFVYGYYFYFTSK